ncbi:MAG: SPOR domain-containing protein [Bacteroidales bacterium]|nr:SPOR domain-containing protein [Bacteroidales bacterium]
MNSVIRHIEYLISRTDCVIIPGLGAILARNVSAWFDAEQMVMHAPRRVFSFNPSLIHSDGTLCCSIARAQGIQYDAAAEIVDTEVEAMRRQLRIQGEVSLGRIGTLSFNSETQTIDFLPFEADTLSVATAWLPTLDLTPQKAEEQAEVETPVLRPISRFAQFVRIAASIAVLIAICFIASTPISIDEAALASLSPEIKQTPVESLLPSQPEVTPQITVYTSHPEGIAMDIDQAPGLSTPTKNFCLVVGSFLSQQEAEKFIAANKGQGLGIFETQGRYRVYSGAYDTEIEAYQALRTQKQGAWVCRMDKQ